tara:strand:+ start:56516 stop:56713 length:198 start_codon:yes stop_codon:yes gene_type:complete
MKMSYFADTDTLYIEFRSMGAADTIDLDDNTVVDYDAAGNIVAITLEHASARTDLQNVTLSGIAA